MLVIHLIFCKNRAFFFGEKIMRSIVDVMTWLFVSLYVISMIGLLPIGIYAFISDQKKRRLFSKDISEKISADIDVDVELVRQISKARNIKEGMAVSIIRKLMADSRDKKDNDFYLELCKKLEEITPYSDFSQDIRSSLLKIKQIIGNSGAEYDSHLMEPIVSNLLNYIELKQDYAKTKRINLFLNILTVISFFVGAWGVYLSFNTPDINEIQNAVQNVMQEKTNNLQPEILVEPPR